MPSVNNKMADDTSESDNEIQVEGNSTKNSTVPNGILTNAKNELQHTFEQLNGDVFENWKNFSAEEVIKIDPNLVSYRPTDNPWELYNILFKIQPPKRIDYFLEKQTFSQTRKENVIKIVDNFNRILQTSELAPLKPKLILTGPIAADLALYNSPIDIAISIEHKEFSKISEKTKELLIDTVEAILKRQYGISPSDRSRFSFLKICKYQKVFVNQKLFYEVNFSVEEIEVEERKAEILKRLADFDPRFKQLSLLLFYWAKQNRLVGGPNATFSWYTFALLIVFYLQNASPSILPPISSLDDFPKMAKPIPRNKNKASIFSLTLLFFKFYHFFNYYQFVIAPRVGSTQLIKRDELEDNESYNDALICIEDPFNPEINLGKFCKNVFNWEFLLLKFAEFVPLKPPTFVAALCNASPPVGQDKFNGVMEQFILDMKQYKMTYFENDDFIYLMMGIDNCFEDLAKFLANEDADYRSSNGDYFEEFAIYGDRLKEYIVHCKYFPKQKVDQYLGMMEQYEALHPPVVLKIREEVLRHHKEPKKQKFNFEIDHEMIGYFQIEPE